ncbi:hypothetical protein GPX89_24335 [Nocardia sp. ET3-3]|uniref:Uncharacterized protein n=1 Tax=Nocardia terrae TaxID=2675851 RepID=A0A7K1V189_9NOCA|nr:hypothetical protein [Nocardia terrae]MVU80365.1 hypothetical protein [Nocardia terrae]
MRSVQSDSEDVDRFRGATNRWPDFACVQRNSTAVELQVTLLVVSGHPEVMLIFEFTGTATSVNRPSAATEAGDLKNAFAIRHVDGTYAASASAERHPTAVYVIGVSLIDIARDGDESWRSATLDAGAEVH